MVIFDNKEYLRLPTEKEIFGVNEYGEEEDTDVEQFERMKKERHRIAFQGYGIDVWGWYRLDNRHKSSANDFVLCGFNGVSTYLDAFADGGVRPLFLLKNL